MTEDTLPTELDLLKERARKLGITFSNNIGLESLKEKVKNEMESLEPKQAVDEDRQKRIAKAEERKKAKLSAEKLVRIRITCMNPAKKEFPGEIFTVSNKLVGTQKKFIPFTGHEEGYHVPQMILNVLKERKFQQFTNVKLPNGDISRKGKLVKEFAIEILPPLTQAELKDLAKAQAAAGGV